MKRKAGPRFATRVATLSIALCALAAPAQQDDESIADALRAARRDADAARAESRFLTERTPTLPEAPDARLTALRRELAVLDRVAALERIAFDRRLDAEYAQGPGTDGTDVTRHLDDVAVAGQAVDDAIAIAERDAIAERLRTLESDDERDAWLAARRDETRRRWRGAVANRALLDAERARLADALRTALRHATTASNRTEDPAPLRDLEHNARARWALAETLRLRTRLCDLEAERARHERTTARIVARWTALVPHLSGDASASQALPRDPAGLAALRGEAVAAERAARLARIDLARDNARTRATLRTLVAHGTALEAGYRRQMRRPARRLPPARVPAPPTLGAGATQEMRTLAQAIADAHAERAALGAAMWRCTTAWKAAIERGLGAAAAVANGSESGRTMLHEASEETARRVAESKRQVERLRALDRSLLADTARLSLLAEPAPEPTRTLRERVEAWLGRLPSANHLLPAAALLLLIGLVAGHATRFRRLGFLVRFVCIAAAAGLVGIGLTRPGVDARLLAGTSGLATLMLIGSLPLDLVAGLGFRFTGHARPGTMVSNGRLEGRVVRRGLFRSTLALEHTESARIIDVGNALLARRVSEESGSRSDAAARPRTQRVEARLTLDSDWMAIRQLIERLAAAHAPGAPTQLDVDARTIRLRIELAPGRDAEPLRHRLELAIAQAPFARLVEAPRITRDDDPAAEPA